MDKMVSLTNRDMVFGCESACEPLETFFLDKIIFSKKNYTEKNPFVKSNALWYTSPQKALRGVYAQKQRYDS